MTPYKTEPVLIEKIWGGNRLIKYNKDFSGKIGESIEYNGEKDGIPLIIKLIDASDDLSIQVHPDKRAATALGDGFTGKDELWVILDCEEDSEIFYGFNGYYEKNAIKDAAINGSIVDMLNRIKVKKGDCIFIPSGTVHALGKGVLAYELQEASDLTYRLYDWDRTENGEKRELHIEKALYSIKKCITDGRILNVYADSYMDCRLVCLGEYEYFGAIFAALKNEESIMQRCDETKIISVIFGEGFLCYKNIKTVIEKGDTVVVPEDPSGFVSIISSGGLRYIESRHIRRLCPEV
ncbi:Mannose-6-phosphate isomerase ManA [bioreactor metagenome]|uniref:Mannose-6-phosphate isomerase ManA n=1 Tax=bioreactor metagenome TaxID=1076179 RepID=A0A645AJP5_9ZZZZ|nr:type I phosphomannose isomerase catalytic subunit [Lutispora sp.]MEA4961527.1 type I phosphomannose isomerase catalytic subunit [Lutispora sp.]